LLGKTVETTESLPATEAVSPRFESMETWPSAEILRALWEAQMDAVAAVRPALAAITAAADAAVPLLTAGGRLAYAGAGTSARIGAQDGAELPPTFDWPQDRLILLIAGGEAALTHGIENAEDDTEAAIQAVSARSIGARDVVIGIAASGTTPFTIACVEQSARNGALTIGIASTQDSPLLTASAYPVLLETGAEPLAGSTRMKAGTAQKVALNLFSTLVMLRLGRAYRGLMVDMQARNEKLRGRAVRMLRTLTGADGQTCRAALGEAGGHVKTAVLLVHGLTAHEAGALLRRHKGNLRGALQEIGR
jgi:N-acetylmuramic acid 6-phosphate etherase